jgi:hypothetical protein
LWHQFTTVVMLRQNMRQQVQTPADDELRTALENMRCGACMDDDIEFLESRIAGFRLENLKLSGRDVRNVSIITARNSQKDTLNKLGAACFAKDTNKILHHFCSVDRTSPRAVDKSKWKTCLQSDIKKCLNHYKSCCGTHHLQLLTSSYLEHFQYVWVCLLC